MDGEWSGPERRWSWRCVCEPVIKGCESHTQQCGLRAGGQGSSRRPRKQQKALEASTWQLVWKMGWRGGLRKQGRSLWSR